MRPMSVLISPKAIPIAVSIETGTCYELPFIERDIMIEENIEGLR
jgi:hypothetical protein